MSAEEQKSIDSESVSANAAAGDFVSFTAAATTTTTADRSTISAETKAATPKTMTATTTLVIHPRDTTTDFLRVLYDRTPNCTVFTAAKSGDELRAAIAAHDRVVLLGHGCAAGLVDARDAFGGGACILIGDAYASLLGAKKNSVYVWCMADEYVRKHKLSGFCTAMFISEPDEAVKYRVVASDEQIAASNELFVACLAKCIDGADAAAIRTALVDGPYGELAKTNAVAAYNCARLFAFPPSA